eukprot:CAMPEP_0176418548 /NCGR_PEP_ID=MMETSP0127-20121128/7530_1 /TAXON_ID=938130 /ORGANISM="Platyophrya macrostoma, Strain WH" /LENGTH=54 /DNA_ID=CAMNT_0017798881 /DNA_START=198 /DNA_END=362 /DNA_ORIENTATION=-
MTVTPNHIVSVLPWRSVEAGGGSTHQVGAGEDHQVRLMAQDNRNTRSSAAVEAA